MRDKYCRCAAWTATLALAIFRASTGAAAEGPAPPPTASSPSVQPAAVDAAAAAAAAELDPNSLLIFSVELESLTLTDGMSAYGSPEDPMLPVGEITRLLEMDVEVLPAERRILGRIGEARQSLVVDLKSGTVRLGARVVPLAAADVAVTPTEIYVRATALQRLLPMKFQVEPEALILKIVPTETLPVQGRMQRVARQRDMSQTFENKEDILNVATPYQLFTMPAFDMALGLGFQSRETPQIQQRYDIRIGADLFYTGFQGYVGSDENGKPSSARFVFERRSVEGRLLGPLKARTFSFGDVFTPTLALGPRGVGGRGFTFSTVPLDQTNIFNRVDLRGELPLGYDVELYVNDILRSGQNTPAKGRYEFLNVPLSQGINVVRIVTYGPRGERSEETRIVNVGAGLLRRGEATFEFGAVQQEEEVLKLGVEDGTTIPSPGRGGLRVVAGLNYGLSQYLTLTAGGALIPTINENDYRQLVTLGARTSVLGFATQLDIAADNRNASAVALGLAGQLFGVSTVLRHGEFRGGFIDENGPGVDLLTSVQRRSEVSFDGNLQVFGRVVPLSLRVLRSELVNGTVDLTGSTRASGTAAGVLFSAGMEYQNLRSPSFSSQRLSGFFAGSTFRSYTWQLRSTIDFDIVPELKLRQLAITADRDLNEWTSIRFGLGQSLEDFNSFNLTASSIFKLRFADLLLTGEYSNADQGWRVGAQLNFGLSFNPAERRYVMTRPGPAAGGSVLFEAFLDRNGNGIFDGDDTPVPNVTLEGAERKAVTGPNGRAFVTGLGSAPSARLLVGLDNVDNTSVQAPPATVQFSPRGGSFTTVRYPMKPTGEVMIRVLLVRDKTESVGLSAARLRLVGDNGFVAEASSEFDGSTLFPNLPVGVYKVELDPDQAQRLRMHLIAPVSVTIKGDGSFVPDAQAEVKFEPRTEDKATDATALETK